MNEIGKKSFIISGDALLALKKLPSESIQCVITSPPYWGLRDYGVEGQLGIENDLEEYINNLVLIFDEILRVLKKDGTLWLNIGDGFTSGDRGYRASDKKNTARGMNKRPGTPNGLKPKDLIGIPWRLAFALQSKGWYLRTDIIWHKKNGMPESVKDRPYRNHEYLFLFSKSEKYYFNNKPLKISNEKLRSVWSLNTNNKNYGHSAVFPSDLIKPCILCSTKPGEFVLDPFFGSGTVGSTSKRLKRQFIGIELNSLYVKDSLKRFSSPPEVVRICELSSYLTLNQTLSLLSSNSNEKAYVPGKLYKSVLSKN